MAVGVQSQTMEKAWKECTRIKKQIEKTSFPDLLLSALKEWDLRT